MRAESLGNGRLLELPMLNARVGWRQLSARLKAAFNGDFKSDWEKKTGMPWKEWSKWGEFQDLERRK